MPLVVPTTIKKFQNRMQFPFFCLCQNSLGSNQLSSKPITLHYSHLHLFLFLLTSTLTSSSFYYHNYLIDSAPKSFQSVYERKFADYNGQENDGFGRAVDIYKNYMVVGSCFADTHGYQSGSAHIFKLTDSTSGWEYDSQLSFNDTKAYDFFGWDVSITLGVAAVGAWQHDSDSYENNGAVYIFDHIRIKNHMRWNMTTKLIGIYHHQHFGISLSFSKDGSHLFIGASGDSGIDHNDGVGIIGIVYVVTKDIWTNTWIIQTSLRPADVGPYDYYGISVATHNHVAVIGAYGQNSGNGDASGAAYVYSNQNTDYSHWYIEAHLVASDGQQEDYFGRSVAIYDRTVVVGADGDDDCGISSGSAYIFRSYAGNTWTQIQKLYPSEDSSYTLFGGSVAIYGDILIIGADADSHNDGRTGAVWYYTRSYYWLDDDAVITDDDYSGYSESWSCDFELLPSDQNSRDLYGTDVAIYEKSLLIGAEVSDGYEANAGACYVYTTPPQNIDELLSSDQETSTLEVIGMTMGMFLITAVFLLLAKRYHLLDRVNEFRTQSFTPPQYHAALDDSIATSTSPLTTSSHHLDQHSGGWMIPPARTSNTTNTNSIIDKVNDKRLSQNETSLSFQRPLQQPSPPLSPSRPLAAVSQGGSAAPALVVAPPPPVTSPSREGAKSLTTSPLESQTQQQTQQTQQQDNDVNSS